MSPTTQVRKADLIKYRTSPPAPLLSKERGEFDLRQ
jgi:hypothetical protein